MDTPSNKPQDPSLVKSLESTLDSIQQASFNLSHSKTPIQSFTKKEIKLEIINQCNNHGFVVNNLRDVNGLLGTSFTLNKEKDEIELGVYNKFSEEFKSICRPDLILRRKGTSIFIIIELKCAVNINGFYCQKSKIDSTISLVPIETILIEAADKVENCIQTIRLEATINKLCKEDVLLYPIVVVFELDRTPRDLFPRAYDNINRDDNDVEVLRKQKLLHPWIQSPQSIKKSTTTKNI